MIDHSQPRCKERDPHRAHGDCSGVQETMINRNVRPHDQWCTEQCMASAEHQRVMDLQAMRAMDARAKDPATQRATEVQHTHTWSDDPVPACIVCGALSHPWEV